MRRVVARGAVKEVILINLDILAESQDLVDYLTSNPIKNLLFSVLITHSVKQHTQVAVADEAKFYNQSVGRANQDEQGTPPSPLTRMYPDSSHPSSEEEK